MSDETDFNRAKIPYSHAIESSEITRSLIAREARVESANLDGALIGVHTKVLGE